MVSVAIIPVWGGTSVGANEIPQAQRMAEKLFFFTLWNTLDVLVFWLRRRGVGVQKMIYLDGDHSRPPKRADEGENREKDWKSWK